MNHLLGNSLRIVLILLISVCIFDPADELLGIKVHLFVLAWILFIHDITANNKTIYIPIKLMLYLILFILIIPLTSIAYYFFTGSDFINYDGYMYFKSYLFLTVVIILYISKIDLIKPTIIMISLLSILTIIIFISSIFTDSFVQFLHLAIGAVPADIGARAYGNFVFPQIYFHTSPLILFPIGYFSLAVLDSKGIKRIFYILLLVINIVAMFLGGTRNNIMFSIITPMFVAYWYSKRKILVLFIIITLSSIILVSHLDIIKSMFDVEQPSNIWKSSFLKDYLSLFADEKVLFFGQGLGSYFNTTMRGYVSITELTYFEFIRRFGLILSLASFALILYPLGRLKLKRYHSVHYIFISYLFYLIMCFFNPLLMSSTGMLLLSLVLYKTFSFPSVQNKFYRDQDNPKCLQSIISNNE